jgi:murein DD-endopeptidase MepM/ murein hydrolase activator NlpD
MFTDRSVREGEVLAYTGMSGNAAGIPAAEAHLHFEIRQSESVAGGLSGRLDPGEVFGYGLYSSKL